MPLVLPNAKGKRKTHTEEVKKLISKPGEANPMFGRKHSEYTKLLMSKRMSKYPGGVGLYDPRIIYLIVSIIT